MSEDFGRGWVFWLLCGWILVLMMTCLPALVRAQEVRVGGPEGPIGMSDVSRTVVGASGTASVIGVVLDTAGAAVPEAVITLEGDGHGKPLRALSGGEGLFALENVAPGSYRVRVERVGFKSWSGPAEVIDGQLCTVRAISLGVSESTTAIEVRASGREVAQAQVALEEQQRVLGVFPNFYASYAPDAEPLSAGQKFQLAWRFVNDPVALGMAGVVAGSEQRADTFHGYGRGVAGYSKRYGAAYADGLTSTVIGQALLPAVLHQDPRYFVKGTGSTGSRVLYAMASMVICKGDNRRWQPNYSNVLGNFASASLSTLYYPAANRGGSPIVQNAMTATLLGAVGGLFQEFFLHRMTPGVPDYAAMR